jgi:hypothetical protein
MRTKHLLEPRTGRVRHFLFCTALAALLVGCGGGSGDSGGGAPPPTVLAKLNDTGVSVGQCFAAGSEALVACDSAPARALSPLQDGALGRDASAATNTGSDGKLGFQFSAMFGGCVRDEVTGLIWEPKPADGGLRDHTRTYTNYGDRRAGDASEFVDLVNASSLCGFSDWRLPTMQELHSLLDYGAMTVAAPWIDAAWFPNTSQPHYWTSTVISPQGGQFSRVKWVQFNPRGFLIQPGDRSEHYGVRLVRGGGTVLPAKSRFSVSADNQEVTDLQTGLVWRRCTEGTSYVGGTCTGSPGIATHEQALQLATATAAATGQAWRLPNAKELISLADPDRRSPARDPDAFPPVAGSVYWASTPCGNGAAATIDFEVGSNACLARSLPGFVQLVRDPS